MKEIMTPAFKQEDEEEEFSRLSFCDLPSSGAAIPHRPLAPSAEPDHLFEFSAAAHSDHDDIVFFGRIIDGGGLDHEDGMNEFQKRDYFATVKSRSLRKPSLHRRDAAAEGRRLSASTRFGGGDPVYHAQRVNISSLTSMSAKSRRRMFMFGPVKFKPEMELSAIKQRQGKMAIAAEKAAPQPSGGGKSHWGVVKSSLRGRSHLVSLLARSLGCIPVAAGGGGGGGLERWGMGVAN